MNNWLNKIKTKKCIYQRKNEIFVFENQRYRWLTFNDSFIQSLMDKKKPQKLLIPYLDVLCLFYRENPGKTCLLGLGSGSLVHHLQKENHPLTVVELLPDVIEIAKKFFYLPQSSQIQMHAMCAMDFMKNTDDMFQHIIIDLGNHQGFPKACKSSEFFQDVYTRLAPNGFLALNLPSFSDLEFFKPLFKSLFHTSPLIISAQGNWILFASKQYQQADLIKILQNKHYLKSFTWHPSYGDLAILHHPFSQQMQLLIKKLSKYMAIF